MEVTLVPYEFAKEGVEFQYLGPAAECRECRLKNVCLRLQEGKCYRITKIRENEHECRVHSGGKVVVAEVEEIPMKIAINKKFAIEGAMVEYQGIRCRNRECQYYEYCRPYKLTAEKLKIEKVLEEISCPLKILEPVLVLVRW